MYQFEDLSIQRCNCTLSSFPGSWKTNMEGGDNIKKHGNVVNSQITFSNICSRVGVFLDICKRSQSSSVWKLENIFF